jgi:histidine ammonia-lyase
LTNKITLTEEGLTFEDIRKITLENYQLTLSEEVEKRVKLARQAIEQAVKEGQKIYGITTGFGALRDIIIPEKDAIKLQKNLIRSHSVGVGDPAPDEYVKAMMTLRVSALARGNSGCKLSTIQNLIAMINKNVLPIVPLQGSVGASGDLAPLSHMALAMIGEGKKNLKFQGKIYDAKEGLKKAGISITELSYKEGLALNNGAQFSAGIACIVLNKAMNIIENAEIAAALSMEALRAARQQFDKRIHQARNHEGQITTAKNLRDLTKNSNWVKIYENSFYCSNPSCGYYYDKDLGDKTQTVSPGTVFGDLPGDWTCPNCSAKKATFQQCQAKIQDDYSIRCSPQVIGPVRDTIGFVKSILTKEINAATDNPLIFIKKEKPLAFDIYSGGNFHGEPIALAMDFLAIAIAEIGSISERRSAKLIDKNRNEGLSPFLTHVESLGLNSGYMMPQYTAAALASENKVLASPASVDSIPTSADAEDHVSMSPIAARKAATIVKNLQYILAIEILMATQAIDLRCEIQKADPEDVLGDKTLQAYKYIRKMVPKLMEDRILYPEIERIAEEIAAGKILQAIKNSP